MFRVGTLLVLFALLAFSALPCHSRFIILQGPAENDDSGSFHFSAIEPEAVQLVQTWAEDPSTGVLTSVSVEPYLSPLSWMLYQMEAAQEWQRLVLTTMLASAVMVDESSADSSQVIGSRMAEVDSSDDMLQHVACGRFHAAMQDLDSYLDSMPEPYSDESQSPYDAPDAADVSSATIRTASIPDSEDEDLDTAYMAFLSKDYDASTYDASYEDAYADGAYDAYDADDAYDAWYDSYEDAYYGYDSYDSVDEEYFNKISIMEYHVSYVNSEESDPGFTSSSSIRGKAVTDSVYDLDAAMDGLDAWAEDSFDSLDVMSDTSYDENAVWETMFGGDEVSSSGSSFAGTFILTIWSFADPSTGSEAASGDLSGSRKMGVRDAPVPGSSEEWIRTASGMVNWDVIAFFVLLGGCISMAGASLLSLMQLRRAMRCGGGCRARSGKGGALAEPLIFATEEEVAAVKLAAPVGTKEGVEVAADYV